MAIFAEVVAAGSLTAAARQLGMTPSAVSQHLRQLEESLGLALLHRSTRRLTLTEAGERYHTGCAAMVAAARSADQALARLRDEPEGELRLAAPIGFGGLLATALAPLRAHPKLALHLLLDDAVIDLIAARVDIALRVGALADSTLVARKLGSMKRQLCASPAYLAGRGWPAQPQDLLQHDWLGGRPGAAGGELLDSAELRDVEIAPHRPERLKGAKFADGLALGVAVLHEAPVASGRIEVTWCTCRVATKWASGESSKTTPRTCPPAARGGTSSGSSSEQPPMLTSSTRSASCMSDMAG